MTPYKVKFPFNKIRQPVDSALKVQDNLNDLALLAYLMQICGFGLQGLSLEKAFLTTGQMPPL